MSKANSKKHFEMIRKIAEWQKKNLKKFYYTHSTFGILKTEDPSVEALMYIDEYKDQKSYDKFSKAYSKE